MDLLEVREGARCSLIQSVPQIESVSRYTVNDLRFPVCFPQHGRFGRVFIAVPSHVNASYSRGLSSCH
jgi:hypothetical protein